MAHIIRTKHVPYDFHRLFCVNSWRRSGQLNKRHSLTSKSQPAKHVGLKYRICSNEWKAHNATTLLCIQNFIIGTTAPKYEIWMYVNHKKRLEKGPTSGARSSYSHGWHSAAQSRLLGSESSSYRVFSCEHRRPLLVQIVTRFYQSRDHHKSTFP